MNNSSEKPTFSQANFANLSDEEKKIIGLLHIRFLNLSQNINKKKLRKKWFTILKKKKVWDI